jgi:DNA-binding MarR family transcriptional regulator
MTTTEPDLAAAPPEVVQVADEFIRLMRSFTRMKQQFLAAAEHDVEWSSHMVLRCLAVEGPMRSSALAERMESDPSTVSRQVAALVRDGLVERRADPVDGRATLLVPTERAEAVLADHNAQRNRHFARMLADWDEQDLKRFAELLERFTHDFTKTKNQWLPARATTPAPAGRND